MKHTVFLAALAAVCILIMPAFSMPGNKHAPEDICDTPEDICELCERLNGLDAASQDSPDQQICPECHKPVRSNREGNREGNRECDREADAQVCQPEGPAMGPTGEGNCKQMAPRGMTGDGAQGVEICECVCECQSMMRPKGLKGEDGNQIAGNQIAGNQIAPGPAMRSMAGECNQKIAPESGPETGMGPMGGDCKQQLAPRTGTGDNAQGPQICPQCNKPVMGDKGEGLEICDCDCLCREMKARN